uniref:CBS domain-containing protein n=1 Tax=Schlesneria paludicola TaxID=360056 RepID=A0A7C4LN60_9PLAN
MICPECEHDNIPGVDECANCGSPLTSDAEALSELELSITQHPISALGGKPPLTVSAEDSVRDAIARMNAARVGCVLVEEQGSIVGIFTERDVLNRVTPDLGTLDRPVREVMTRSPETVQQDDSVAYALHAMSVNGYRHLPVADERGRAVAIISARDVLRLFASRLTTWTAT